MRTLDRPLPEANAPLRLQNDELREIVAAYKDRESELLTDLEESQVAILERKQEFDHKDSKIKGLQRRLNAIETQKIAILVYSPTGHHKVELAGPWTLSDYADLVKPFRLEVHLQTGDSKNREAVAAMRERAQLERDEEYALSRLLPDERQGYVDGDELPLEPDGTVKPEEVEATTGKAFANEAVDTEESIKAEDSPDEGPQPDGDIESEKPVSGMADFATAELSPGPPKVKHVGNYGTKK